MKLIFILVLPLVLVLSCDKTSDKPKEEMALNLQKGFEQTLIYSLTTSGNKNGNMNESTEVKYRVDSVDQMGNYYLTGEILRMTYNQEMFGESLHYDSSEKTGNDELFSEEIDPLINNPFTFKVNKFGEVSGNHKFATEVNSELEINQYNIVPLKLPKEKISEGFSWSDLAPNPLFKSQESKTDYTITKIDDNDIEIDFKGESKGMEPFTKDVPIIGKYILDRKTKVLKSGERKLDVQIGGGEAIFTITPKMEGF